MLKKISLSSLPGSLSSFTKMSDSEHFEVGFTEEIVETMEWNNPNIQLGELDQIWNVPENQASFISQNPLTNSQSTESVINHWATSNHSWTKLVFLL